MSNLVNGLMEAYTAVYDEDLREELKEEREVEELALEIIENASYVLFSQGYDVEDVISYFTEVSEEVIVEDFVNFADGNLIIESFAVSDEYIEEQFEVLNENIMGALRGGVQRVLGAGAGAMKGGGGIRSAAGAMLKSAGRASRQYLGKAAGAAKELVKKIPGAGLVSKVAKGPVGKIVGRAAPGVGAALYGMDAVSRAKKGDWGGAALSGLGAGLSLAPGVGTLASLAPAGVQMATDAMGLTGDKSKKGPSAKTAPAKPPSLKAKQDYATSKGKYYSSSDQKTYKNYNDALAARNSRLGKLGKNTPTPPAPSLPAAPAKPAAPSAASPAKPAAPAPAKPAAKGPYIGTTKAGTKFVQRAATSDELRAAQAARKAGAGEEGAVKAAVERSQPTTGPATAQVDPKSVEADIKAQQERDRKKAQQQAQPVNASYEYDAYDLVLEYLIDNGHAETVDEAHYIMLEMDAQMVGDIVEETLQEKLKPGTKRVQFSTGKDDKFNQAMTERNPRTGRQRATSPELKAMGAHGRAKSAQYDAENRGDTEAARRHETRRGKIAHTVYRKTGRIIDRADND